MRKESTGPWRYSWRREIMTRADSIAERLPHFYMTWNGQTAISSILRSIGKTMDETEKDFRSMMASHWVDTAHGEDLDSLGAVYNFKRKSGETDYDFRGRLKTSIISYRGGGTLSSLRMMARIALGLSQDYPIEIVENPPVGLKQTWRVSANSDWQINPRNIMDTTPEITIAVETENASITDPTVTNLDTGEYVTFHGSMSFGDVLKIKEGKATLNGKDVTKKLSTDKMPTLPRKKTTWQYTEAIGANIGAFDRSQFDRSVFAVSIITAITLEWTACQPASFEVRIPKDLLGKSGMSKEYIQELVDSVKACGVRGEVVVV
jgi:hypothetical protein